MEKFPGNLNDVYDKAFPSNDQNDSSEGETGKVEGTQGELSEQADDLTEQVAEISELEATELAKEEFGWLENELSPASYEKLITQQAQKLLEWGKIAVRKSD